MTWAIQHVLRSFGEGGSKRQRRGGHSSHSSIPDNQHLTTAVSKLPSGFVSPLVDRFGSIGVIRRLLSWLHHLASTCTDLRLKNMRSNSEQSEPIRAISRLCTASRPLCSVRQPHRTALVQDAMAIQIWLANWHAKCHCKAGYG